MNLSYARNSGSAKGHFHRRNAYALSRIMGKRYVKSNSLGSSVYCKVAGDSTFNNLINYEG
jgi:hypothetical protein